MKAEEKLIKEFTSVWANPTLERISAMLHPDVVLHWPGRSASKGKQEAMKQIKRAFDICPKFYGTVQQSYYIENLIFIEWIIHFPFKSKTLSVKAIDKIVPDGGLVGERHVFFDTAKIYRYILTHPTLWYRLYKFRN